MNKTKIALTIIKLVGIALLLTIALLTSILIEGLQLLSNLIQLLSEEKVEGAVKQLLLIPSIPIKFPAKPKWMIDLLPVEYLDIKHLKALAKQLKIKSYSKLSKGKLLLALNHTI